MKYWIVVFVNGTHKEYSGSLSEIAYIINEKDVLSITCVEQ